MNVSRREHCNWARDLIRRCGGLDEAAKACRVSVSKLSDYQNEFAALPLWMPADVIADLEAKVGEPIYSRALFERVSAAPMQGDLRDSCEELVEDAAALMATGRRALADGKLSQRDLNELQAGETRAEAALEHIRAIRRAMEAHLDAPKPSLRAD